MDLGLQLQFPVDNNQAVTGCSCFTGIFDQTATGQVEGKTVAERLLALRGRNTRGNRAIHQLCAEEIVQANRFFLVDVGRGDEFKTFDGGRLEGVVGPSGNRQESVGRDEAVFFIDKGGRESEIDAWPVFGEAYGEDPAVGGVKDVLVRLFVPVFHDGEGHRSVARSCGAVGQNVCDIAIPHFVVEGPTVVGGTHDPSGGGRVAFGRKRE